MKQTPITPQTHGATAPILQDIADLRSRSQSLVQSMDKRLMEVMTAQPKSWEDLAGRLEATKGVMEFKDTLQAASESFFQSLTQFAGMIDTSAPAAQAQAPAPAPAALAAPAKAPAPAALAVEDGTILSISGTSAVAYARGKLHDDGSITLLKGATFKRKPGGAGGETISALHMSLVGASFVREGGYCELSEDMHFSTVSRATCALYSSTHSAGVWKHADGSCFKSERAKISKTSALYDYMKATYPHAQPDGKQLYVTDRDAFLIRTRASKGVLNGFMFRMGDLEQLTHHGTNIRFITTAYGRIFEVPLKAMLRRVSGGTRNIVMAIQRRNLNGREVFTLSIGGRETDFTLEGTPIDQK